MRVLVSSHAVERFIERHQPELSYPQAKRTLAELAWRAERSREVTPDGRPIWYADGVPLVFKEIDARRERIVLTVLPARQPHVLEDVEPLLEESAADRAAMRAMLAADPKGKR